MAKRSDNMKAEADAVPVFNTDGGDDTTDDDGCDYTVPGAHSTAPFSLISLIRSAFCY